MEISGYLNAANIHKPSTNFVCLLFVVMSEPKKSSCRPSFPHSFERRILHLGREGWNLLLRSSMFGETQPDVCSGSVYLSVYLSRSLCCKILTGRSFQWFERERARSGRVTLTVNESERKTVNQQNEVIFWLFRSTNQHTAAQPWVYSARLVHL